MTKNNGPLSVRGLCKDYPSFHLSNVFFDLARGAVTGLIGRNGAGKTTTLNAVLAFVRPTAGEVAFWGMRMAEHAREIKEKIGFVSAGMTYYTTKPLKTITAVTRSFYSSWEEETYRTYMDRFRLEESKTPAALSNGMKIKYALALALSHGAELLILDEPTSGLDPVSREELLEIFLDLRDAGKTILFSTHITSDLDKTADDILYISGGKLRAQSSLNDFISAYRLAEYGSETVLPEEEALLSGRRRTREGFTALVKAADAPRLSVSTRAVNLEEIMVHLEKEAE